MEAIAIRHKEKEERSLRLGLKFVNNLPPQVPGTFHGRAVQPIGGGAWQNSAKVCPIDWEYCAAAAKMVNQCLYTPLPVHQALHLARWRIPEWTGTSGCE